MLVQFYISIAIVKCKSNPMIEKVKLTSTYECTLCDEWFVFHGVANIICDILVNHS